MHLRSEVSEAISALQSRLSQSQGGWNDQVRAQFERDYIAPILDAASSYVTEYGRAAKVGAEALAFAEQIRPLRF